MKKIIFITGASSGIGKYTAIEFSKNKWTVLAAARRKNLLAEVSKEASKKYGGKIIPIALDITKENEVKKIINKCFRLYGTPNICLLNEGTNNPNEKKIINLNEAKKIFKINYFGTLNCIDAILPNLLTSKKNTQLAIMASVAGYRGLPYATAYCSSKAALINLAESIYSLCKNKNILVRLINPGFIKTPLTDKNKFEMPFIIPANKAAKILYKKLNNSTKFEINLPWTFCIIMKILSIVPYSLYFKITSKMIRRL